MTTERRSFISYIGYVYDMITREKTRKATCFGIFAETRKKPPSPRAEACLFYRITVS